MKGILLFTFYFIGLSFSYSQKMDYNWLLGCEQSSNPNFHYVSQLKFSTDTVEVDSLKMKMYFDCDNLSMSDSFGNLIFYSNGFSIAGIDLETLQNGDDLNFCKSKGCSVTGNGLVNYQGIICFPFKNNKYTILHNQVDFVEKENLLNPFSLNVLMSNVSFDKNTKKYKVGEKNIEILKDTLGPGALVATKHANGRDWWCMLKKGNSRELFTLLITPDTIAIQPLQKFESIPILNGLFGFFSPNGSKFIFQQLKGPGSGDYIVIFDFDRCSGILSNPKFIKQNFTNNGTYGGLAVSPNSRFLYVSQNPWLMQLDLDSLDLNHPFDTIAEYDGFKSPFKTYFFYMQNGPDGKIYMCALNGVDVLHVINNPDEKGKACNFTQHSLKLINNSCFSLPNFPNYRLGPLIGSGCDTLTSTTTLHNKDKLSVYPNPASDHFRIEYSGTSGFQKAMELQLIDLSGKVVLKEHLAVYSIYRDVDVTGLAPGLYIWQVKDRGEIVQSGKVVVLN